MVRAMKAKQICLRELRPAIKVFNYRLQVFTKEDDMKRAKANANRVLTFLASAAIIVGSIHWAAADTTQVYEAPDLELEQGTADYDLTEGIVYDRSLYELAVLDVGDFDINIPGEYEVTYSLTPIAETPVVEEPEDGAEADTSDADENGSDTSDDTGSDGEHTDQDTTTGTDDGNDNEQGADASEDTTTEPGGGVDDSASAEQGTDSSENTAAETDDVDGEQSAADAAGNDADGESATAENTTAAQSLVEEQVSFVDSAAENNNDIECNEQDGSSSSGGNYEQNSVEDIEIEMSATSQQPENSILQNSIYFTRTVIVLAVDKEKIALFTADNKGIDLGNAIYNDDHTFSYPHAIIENEEDTFSMISVNVSVGSVDVNDATFTDSEFNGKHKFGMWVLDAQNNSKDQV